VQFVGEQAVDEGGVTKEFFQIIVRNLFQPEFGMFFVSEETNVYWFVAYSLESAIQFQLVGTIIGLAIYNGVILDVRFPLVLYKKLIGHKLTLEDLNDIRPTVAKNLQALLAFDGDVEETFGLTFSVSYEYFGEVKHHDLLPNGSATPVTKQNREEYVSLYVKYLLEASIAPQFEAFAKGFRSVMSGPIISFFRAEELEVLVCGTEELDFKALERVTTYKNGFGSNSRVIRWFWEIVHSLSPEEKKRLLFFVTGTSRAPIKGLGSLPFVIQRAGPDSDRLPASHTCFNILDLPDYSSKEKLEEKLRISIQHFEGFGLR
jgi:hypothetical protein